MYAAIDMIQRDTKYYSLIKLKDEYRRFVNQQNIETRCFTVS